LGAIALAMMVFCSCAQEPTDTVPVVDMSQETDTQTQAETTPSVSTPQTEEDTQGNVEVATGTYVVQTDVSALDESSTISENLYGIFVEDINYALDGGMYPELIKNRSFEYGSVAAQTNQHGWVLTQPDNDSFTFTIGDGTTDGSALHTQNPHYAILHNAGTDYSGIFNKGFLDGLFLVEGEEYTFSAYVKSPDASVDHIKLTVEDGSGYLFYEGTIDGVSGEWGKVELTFSPTLTSRAFPETRVLLEIPNGELHVDMISLMPVDTYEGIPVRKDIGEYLEALNPSFLRFPGGCVIEGRDLESMYSWKDSIGNGLSLTIGDTTSVGDIAIRPQGKSIWNGNATHPYYTTYGLGFYEFFLLCEKLDCLPVPVLNAGTTCPIQSPQYIVFETDSPEFQQCVQDALDLVEFCKGGADTTWGAVRIAMGHEEPFDLQYIGIGNEQSSAEYFEHYGLFVDAFEEALRERPELFSGVQLVIANTAGSGGYAGWDYLRANPDQVTGMVDEHYYELAEWFHTSTARYDSYDRDAQAKVFLGEFAAKTNTLESALSEAAYMTGLEDNADVVEMACYAPLFGNETSIQWTPDLIWYSQDSVFGSVSYYVQQMYANNVGTNILPSTINVGEMPMESALTGKVGLGTWQTSSAYDNLKIVSNEDGSVLYESTFDDADALTNGDWEFHTGDWEIIDGRLVQKKTGLPSNQSTGDSIYLGESTWGNYTLTVDAQILSGSEGFLIPIAVKDSKNSIFWNIGGWNNTVSCLQTVTDNVKSGQIAGTVRNASFSADQVYQLKVVVNDDQVTCYIDDVEYVNYTSRTPSPLYETASVDANGDLILKIVNVGVNPYQLAITLADCDMSLYEETAHVTLLTGENPNDTNSYANPEMMVPTEFDLSLEEALNYDCPKYSLSVIRFHAK
jgi:alpha-L-arabinofuranosidase